MKTIVIIIQKREKKLRQNCFTIEYICYYFEEIDDIVEFMCIFQ